jgi:hypothetical protein
MYMEQIRSPRSPEEGLRSMDRLRAQSESADAWRKVSKITRCVDHDVRAMGRRMPRKLGGVRGATSPHILEDVDDTQMHAVLGFGLRCWIAGNRPDRRD